MINYLFPYFNYDPYSLFKFKNLVTLLDKSLFDSLCCYLHVIFRDHKEYHEFHYPVKIPIRLLKDHDAKVRKYKYHVESSATKNGLIRSLEFIVGPTTDGGIIDRYLTVYYNESQLHGKCKWLATYMKFVVATLYIVIC